MKKNQEINNLYKRFVSDEDHSVFSVDESFLDVTALSVTPPINWPRLFNV